MADDISEVTTAPNPTQVLLKKYPIQENPYVRMHVRRRVFGIKEKELPTSGAEVANLKLAAGIFREYLKRGKFDKNEFEDRVQKNIVRFLDRLDLPSQGRPTDQQLAAMSHMREFYQSVFKEKYEAQYAGAMGEYVAMRTISEQLKKQFGKKYEHKPELMPRVEYSTREEDSKGKIDFWVNFGGESSRRIAVQVKNHNLRYPMEDYIYPLYTQAEVDLLTISLGQAVGFREGFEENKPHFVHNAKLLTQFGSMMENTDVAYVIVPGPKSASPGYNELTGMPLPDYSNKILSELKSKFIN